MLPPLARLFLGIDRGACTTPTETNGGRAAGLGFVTTHLSPAMGGKSSASRFPSAAAVAQCLSATLFEAKAAIEGSPSNFSHEPAKTISAHASAISFHGCPEWPLTCRQSISTATWARSAMEIAVLTRFSGAADLVPACTACAADSLSYHIVVGTGLRFPFALCCAIQVTAHTCAESSAV